MNHNICSGLTMGCKSNSFLHLLVAPNNPCIVDRPEIGLLLPDLNRKLPYPCTEANSARNLLREFSEYY